MNDNSNPSPAAALTVATIVAAMLSCLPQRSAAAESVAEGAAVTGTHIRGTNDSAFPIWIYNRDVIEASGAGTVVVAIRGVLHHVRFRTSTRREVLEAGPLLRFLPFSTPRCQKNFSDLPGLSTG